MTLASLAVGELPDWAQVKPARRAHIGRVAALMAAWADERGIAAAERIRWLAAAWLHDALRDAPADQLLARVPDDCADWPPNLLHGPAAAARAHADGIADRPLLHAVAYHTIGHPDFDACGRALYLADFLEPGRHFDPAGRAVLRARMPHDETGVLREVLRSRLTHLVAMHRKIRSETLAFWNSIAG